MKSFKHIRFVFATAVLAVTLAPALATSARADVSTPPEVSAQTVDSASDQSAQPKAQKRDHWKILPTFNTYFPTSSKTKDTFGSTWPSVGFVIAGAVNDRIYDKLEFHVDGILRSHHSNHAYLFPAGIVYTTRAKKMKALSPFVGASADVYFVNLRVPEENLDSSWKTTVGGSVFAGVDINRNLSIKAAYLAAPKVRGYDVSGFNLTATFGF
ncbi:MAG TPA: hypothetical protein VGK34_08170 [Armatimonadota bacterium]|jgi:hypothetical protein